ncbi:MAG TPA: sugar phosphorylase [Bacteroidales bacterium]|jgi:sucrose phosphorylase|nr:sugar phosphorylase [Bacteroidales bacterium]
MISSFQINPVIADQSDFAGIVARRLQKIYKSGFQERLVNRILALTTRQYDAWPEWSEQDIVLITYGSSIRAENELPLRSLHVFLKENLSEIVSSIHILPFFPYTSDDGFAVSDFMTVNPVLGTWDDVSAIGRDFYLMTDLVINHVSSAHPWFSNYLQNISPGKGFFIETEKGADYSMVIRPRSTALFTRFKTAAGEKDVWTTFSTDQIDLNFSNPEVLIEIIKVLIFYIGRGARFIRLDAIAFLWKCAGTFCLHLDETHEIVKLLRDVATFVRPGTIILTETNVPNIENWSYFGNGDEAHMVYQFSLPPLLLHALFSGNAFYLNRWAHEIPETAANQTFLNYTASHDGIGVRPLEGLLPEHELNALIDGMSGSGGFISMRANQDGSLSPYEMNITWFNAMKVTSKGSDNMYESRYICSQTIMMAMKGIPAFYIHSLLATPNDHKGVESTGRYRTINRKELDRDELYGTLHSDTPQKRIYEELKRLILIRKRCQAFYPGAAQVIIDRGNEVFGFTRMNMATHQTVHCLSNVTDSYITINTVLSPSKRGYDLIADEFIGSSAQIVLRSYQTRWIVEAE